METHKNKSPFNLPNEIFKDIYGYEGLYQISNYGRVKSIARVIFEKNGKKRKIKQTILTQKNNGRNYLSVGLNKNGVPIIHYVHRLAAKAFIINIKNKATVNHRDGNKFNNKIENLEWATYSENNKHSFDTGLKKPSRAMLGKKGSKSPFAKPVLQFDMDGKFIARFSSVVEATIFTGISAGNICGCCRNAIRKTATHSYVVRSAGGFIWKYALK